MLNLDRRPTPLRVQLPRLKSQELFRNSQELIIEHQGQEYRLRLTRNDKLILNK
ncbi:MAG: hemin uptake protein HemP [Panacagrimonas sp.]